MPCVEILLYREGDVIPFIDWLDQIPARARVDCVARLELLERHGRDLRRPHAEYLRDGIYELRIKREGVNYRVLYFFNGRTIVVVSHGLVKQRAAIPDREINLAISLLLRFEANPRDHAFRSER